VSAVVAAMYHHMGVRDILSGRFSFQAL
jgi:hypothetical protein